MEQFQVPPFHSLSTTHIHIHRYLSPHLAKKTVEVVQEAFPLRFKAFHVLHEPFYFDAILAVLKPFLKDKIRRRVGIPFHPLSA